MATLLDEFTALIASLSKSGIEYAVCCGWAMTILGAPRATMDIDLLILSESLGEVWKTVQNLGYWLEGLPMSFHDGVIEIRSISKIDDESQEFFTVDFLLVTPSLETVWQTKYQVEWENGFISVVSRKGLTELKTISGRPQDLFDIERLKELENES